ncbi:hypothetical protein RYJ27_01920 [Microbacterium limosum]|uniref:O-antigen/teichoic acid export membrane protein n=1 Tax=Microbacterium limosum TaxID=3079935 RepID=A0AAU0MHU1_9MICO|nr:hypothetical protein [Microbacterium sp. Y20]WOQ70012.1 hypothetical protein RYJ27_01920 [Microbacterium sp. Y20]
MEFIRKLLGAGSLYLVATLAPTLTLLALTPLVTRTLGAAEYGEVAIVITIYQLGAMLVTFGLPLAVTRHALLGRGGFGIANGIILVGSIGAAACGTSLALAAPLWGGVTFPAVLPQTLAWGVIAGVGLSITTLAQSLFRAAEKVKVFVALAITASVLPPTLGLALITAGQSRTAETYTLGLAVGYVAAGLVALVTAMRFRRPRFSLTETLGAYRIGLPTLPHLVSLPLLISGALAIVSASTNTTTAAELQIAALVGASVLTMLNALNNAWAPMIMKTGTETRPQVLEHSTYVISLVTLVIICVYVVLAPFMVQFIGGPVVQSDAPARASLVVALSGIFQVLYLANIHLTFITGRTGPLALTTPLAAVAALAALQVMTQISLEPPSLILFATAWPLFFALQAVSSAILARRTPFATARTSSSFVPLASAGFVCLGCAVFAPSFGITIATASAALLVSATHCWYRRPRA